MSMLASYRQLNVNVRIVLHLMFLWMSTRELWEFRQLPAYIYSLHHDSTSVGYASSIAGLVQFIISFPAGIYTDKFRRDRMIYLSSAAGLIAIVLSAWAVQSDSITTLYISMGFWGANFALNDSPMESLFADSTPTGDRAKIYAIKHTIEQIGRTAGGLGSAGLFVLMGNHWDSEALKFLILTGIVLSLIPICYQLFLNDDQSLKHSSEAAHLLQDRIDSDQDDDDNEEDSITSDRSQTTEILRRVPYILGVTDALMAIGSGAIIQFFPIFFIQEMGLSPLKLSLLFAVAPVLNGIISLLAQKIAKRCGRTRTVLVLHVLGAVLLMIFSAADLVLLSVFLFLSQNALLSSIKPLKRSILMDTVPKRQRGLWNAIQSFTKMSWAGSAIIGGILSDQFGFRYTFLTFSIVYLISALPLIYLDRQHIDILVADACQICE